MGGVPPGMAQATLGRLSSNREAAKPRSNCKPTDSGQKETNKSREPGTDVKKSHKQSKYIKPDQIQQTTGKVKPHTPIFARPAGPRSRSSRLAVRHPALASIYAKHMQLSNLLCTQLRKPALKLSQHRPQTAGGASTYLLYDVAVPETIVKR